MQSRRRPPCARLGDAADVGHASSLTRGSIDAVENVDQQIERDVHDRHGEHEALHRREIGGDQRLDRKGADARPGEHLFDQHVGAKQEENTMPSVVITGSMALRNA